MKQKLTLTLSIIFAVTIIFFACQDEELPKVTSINKIELTLTEDSTSYVFTQLKCDLNQNPKFEIEQYGYCWDTVANVNIQNQSNNFENLTNQSFTESIENLLPNKTYYVKAYIQNGDVIIYSNELTIQTLDARPVVTTSDITNILANSAQSGGEVEAYETLFPITQRGVCWAKTQNPTIADSLTNNGTGNGTFTSQLQNLDIGVNYYVRAYAINSEGINYGEEKSFSTLDGIPNLKTDSIRNITATSATFYGNILENDGLEILEKGFCWHTSTDPSVDNNTQVVSDNTLGSYNAVINGLAINTTYYVRAYVKNEAGTFYGNELSFTTEDGLPSGLSTTVISDITATTAKSGGTIQDDGGFDITSRGVCWNTITNPTTADSHTTDGTGTGSFTSNITGLNVSSTYYVRAYATNANGTVYGSELSFNTKDGLPSGLSTTAITDITDSSATSGGNITDDGGFAINARGVCWNTNINPTIDNDTSLNGSGAGTFISELKNLSSSTKYYVRAYARNVNGTNYGNEISFETEFVCGDKVKDYDGNEYNTVLIGNQCWLAENLKTTHYADGTPINLVENSTDWYTLGEIDKAMCYYNNTTTNKEIYGGLYTWAAAMDGVASSIANPSEIQGACPDGWHLPSDAEWKELEMYLGMSQSDADLTGSRGTNEGSKIAGNSYLWSNGDLESDAEFGESGFLALPGGYRRNTGDFEGLSNGAAFWSTSDSGSEAWRRWLYHLQSAVSRDNYYYKYFGFSIRCVKD